MVDPFVIALFAGAFICMILRGDLDFRDDPPPSPPRKRKRYRDEED